MVREQDDPVNPAHYTWHPYAKEFRRIAEYFNFNLGCVLKYTWRAGRKGDVLEDLRKARNHIDFEIERILRERGEPDGGFDAAVAAARRFEAEMAAYRTAEGAPPQPPPPPQGWRFADADPAKFRPGPFAVIVEDAPRRPWWRFWP